MRTAFELGELERLAFETGLRHEALQEEFNKQQLGDALPFLDGSTASRAVPPRISHSELDGFIKRIKSNPFRAEEHIRRMQHDVKLMRASRVGTPYEGEDD